MSAEIHTEISICQLPTKMGKNPQDLTEQIRTALEPLERIKVEHEAFKEKSDEKIRHAQTQCEQVRRSADALAMANKDIEAWVFQFSND